MLNIAGLASQTRASLIAAMISLAGNHHVKRTYFFDLKDGVAVRDRLGLEFITNGAAIAHSREIALKLSESDPPGDPDLYVAVVNESGAEIHREPVYPDVIETAASKTG